ncbi:MAG: methyltransferase domain-containing protein, partial [Thermoplasmata archaeon]
CGLAPGAAVFEVGPGTGIATRELLRRGAGPLTLVEPDRRLARYLVRSLGPRADRVTVEVVPFERARLPVHGFELGVAASSFHWLPERLALRRIARALRRGGWWATWNNHPGDPARSSAFHRALQPLYRELSPGDRRFTIDGGGGPGSRRSRAAVVKDRRDRMAALRSVGAFDRISREDFRWTVTLPTARVTGLWRSFSDIAILPPRARARFLAGLGRVADEEFGGAVTFPMLTPLYTARRR